MKPAAHGIHHVTAIAGDARENHAFYTGVLGLRLVKKSVNQDDPGTYHLFYADAEGTPGTDVTFFPWARAYPARPGTGKIAETALAVPAGTLGWWEERLSAAGVRLERATERFGEPTLPFLDPHGLALALVEIAADREFAPWKESPVPVERQIRGAHAVVIRDRAIEPTARLLEDVMGFASVGEDRGRHRFSAGAGSGAYADLVAAPTEAPGRFGVGGVHHVAWRVEDDDEQLALRAAVEATGLRPTPPIDRFWFRSVYFEEPGGALFELATDGPGFARDEDPDHLGEALVLPPWLEPSRAAIEAALPPIGTDLAAS